MLYQFLKILMTLTVRSFFRTIHVRNRECIPQNGPLIICANHPSTFMDPIVIGTLVGRKIHFLAKAQVFKTAFAKWMLARLNMIPVYRKQDDPTLMHKNDETFERCYEHLEKDGVLLIFPEGISLTERKLRQIKTGAARIALGAEARNGFMLGVKILNIGLNYENPHRFKHDLFVNIDDPIDASLYKGEYDRDPVAATQLLTERVRHGLENLIVHIQDQNMDVLVKKIERVYKRKFAKDIGADQGDLLKDFELTRRIANSVGHYAGEDPARVERFEADIDNYLWKLDMAGLDDELLDDSIDRSRFVVNNLAALLLFIFGFPIYLYGMFLNYIPFQFPKIIVRAVVNADEWVGAIGMLSGMLSFLFFYILECLIFLYAGGAISHMLVFLLSLPVSGFFSYYYFHRFLEWKSSWSFVSLFHRRARLVSELIIQRKRIMEELGRAAEDYRKLKGIVL